MTRPVSWRNFCPQIEPFRRHRWPKAAFYSTATGWEQSGGDGRRRRMRRKVKEKEVLQESNLDGFSCYCGLFLTQQICEALSWLKVRRPTMKLPKLLPFEVLSAIPVPILVPFQFQFRFGFGLKVSLGFAMAILMLGNFGHSFRFIRPVQG